MIYGHKICHDRLMFDFVAEQLGHMADVYKRDAAEPSTHILIGDELWESQRKSLSRIVPVLRQTLSGEIQDTTVDGPTWDNFMAIATGLSVLMDSLPIDSVQGRSSETSPSVLSTLPLPRTQEDLLGLMSFLSCTIIEATHVGAGSKIDSTYREFASAGAALILFYAQSLQDQPSMVDILGRYAPEIQLAKMILSNVSDETLIHQSKLVRERIENFASEKIDLEYATE